MSKLKSEALSNKHAVIACLVFYFASIITLVDGCGNERNVSTDCPEIMCVNLYAPVARSCPREGWIVDNFLPGFVSGHKTQPSPYLSGFSLQRREVIDFCVGGQFVNT